MNRCEECWPLGAILATPGPAWAADRPHHYCATGDMVSALDRGEPTAPEGQRHAGVAKDPQGCIRWKGSKVFISSALWGQRVEVACIDGRRWKLSW